MIHAGESDLFAYAKRQMPPEDVPEDVAALFERYAMEVARTGRTRYSADAVLHRIRWHMQIERGDRGFKCNDHWTAPLARWFLRRHPDMEGFFELRRSREDDE